jgi:hypothetical protein
MSSQHALATANPRAMARMGRTRVMAAVMATVSRMMHAASTVSMSSNFS